MRYRFRYDIGPLYAKPPFRRRPPGAGLLAGLLAAVWYVVAFVLQLVVWAVLLAAGLVYTLVWIIVWPFQRLIGGGPPARSRI